MSRLSKNTSSPQSFRDRFEGANRLWQERRFPEAESAYLELLKDDPTSSAAACRIGDVRLALGDRDGANHYFAQAIAINPNVPWGYVGLGRIAEEAGDLETSLNQYQRAIELSPGLPWIVERIATLTKGLSNARRLNNTREALDAFRRRFEHANDLLANHQLVEAEAIYRELLSRDPNSAPLLCKLGGIAIEAGRVDEARTCYDRAIAINREFSWGHVGLSEILDATGDYDGAIKALQTALELDSSLSFAQDRLQSLFKKQRLETERLLGVQIRHWPAEQRDERAGTGDSTRPRVAIVAWDLAHNPVGRALTLAEVARHHADCEIVGPMFTKYGEDLWAPLRDSVRRFDIRGFQAYSFASFMEGAIRLVAEKPCDVAWVSKPCLPSLLIGFLFKLVHGASIVLDIDDDELAFVDGEAPLSLDEFLAKYTPFDWREPFGKRWTQLAASMIGHADAITACNPVLRQKFNGILVRHARDAEPFDEAVAKRDALRAEFGFSDADKVVLFLGTPRPHKGVLEIARALQELGDPSAVLCVVGTITDAAFKSELEALSTARIVFHPDQPYSRVAELNAMADLVCILQDASNPIASAQTPAKLTDALATGTTVLATPVPPLLDMMEPGRIVAVERDGLVDALRLALSGAHSGAEAVAARRAFFRAELTTETNAGRALEAIQAARQKNGPLPPEIFRLLEHIDALMPGHMRPECTAVMKDVLRAGPRIGKLRTLDKDVNLVFFWKQNDSGIFGRRQDMLLQQFAGMPSIRKILHIDAPISVDLLHSLVKSNSGRGFNQGGLVTANTIARHLRSSDDGRIHRRALIYRDKETVLFGQELPEIQSFPNAVETWLRELDMTDNVLAWVCPVVPYFPEVQKRLGFSFIVADVIDDQRQWPMRLDWRVQVERNYRETFAQTSMAFANCRPVSAWLEEEGLKTFVVPNGMDIRRDVETWQTPVELAHLRRPIVGYAGNLSHRIDWELIDQIAAKRPYWSFVIIGEPPNNGRYRQIAARSNVYSMGVLPYETALRHIASFDVAMIPHAHSALSENMNPLKLYVYRGLGVPVVSSAVANLNDLAGDIRIADSADAFVARLDEAIAEMHSRGRTYPAPELMQAYSWESRAAKIMGHVEQVFCGQHLQTNEVIAE